MSVPHSQASASTTLTEAEQAPFWEHTDPSNSDASGQALIEHVEHVLTERLTRFVAAEARMLRFTQHLVDQYDPIDHGVDCEVATQSGAGRCIETAVAVRWENGFADAVCDHHAETAKGRGALVVYPRRHDGSEGNPS